MKTVHYCSKHLLPWIMGRFYFSASLTSGLALWLVLASEVWRAVCHFCAETVRVVFSFSSALVPAVLPRGACSSAGDRGWSWCGAELMPTCRWTEVENENNSSFLLTAKLADCLLLQHKLVLNWLIDIAWNQVLDDFLWAVDLEEWFR